MKVRSNITGFMMTGWLLWTAAAYGQTDTARENKMDSLLMNQKGLLGTIAQNLLADTADEKEKDLQRADVPFQRYRGRIIREIRINPLQFGIILEDTTRRFTNTLTRLASEIHYNTRNFVLRNQLFFKEGDALSPVLTRK